MKVLLVNPPRFQGIPVIREERCEVTERYSILEPYSLLQIGALLRRQGHEVALIDMNGFDLKMEDLVSELTSFRPDMVMFRFTPTTFDHDMMVAKEIKELDKSTITIGICWTLRTMYRNVDGAIPIHGCLCATGL